MIVNQTKITRIASLDILRGLSIAYVVFIHGAIYNYISFTSLDIEHVPLYLLILGMIGLWGGIFAMFSLVVNVYRFLQRGGGRRFTFRALLPLIVVGLVCLFILSTIQMIALGRWILPDPGQATKLTLVAEIIRGQPLMIHLNDLLAGSGIKMVGLNLVVLPLVIYAFFRKRGIRDEAQTYQFFLALGGVVLIFSFLRIFFYGIWQSAIMSHDWFWAWAGSVMFADPYPGILTLAYGFIGSALGVMLYYRRSDLLKRVMLPLGILFITCGGYLLVQQTPTMFGASWFWYFKAITEVGIFILFFTTAIYAAIYQHVNGRTVRARMMQIARYIFEPMSRICLTMYLFETTTSEVLRHVWTAFSASWSSSLNLCLVFGVTNLIAWMVISQLWKRTNYRYSLEWMWVSCAKWLGKRSTKLDTETA